MEGAFMGRLTTHVLDTAQGKPGAGIPLTVLHLEGDRRRQVAAATTNADGRVDRPLLDGEAVAVDHVDPTRTVLNFLREDLARTGTKEGCAEGDCGACMVVLGELDGAGVRFRAVNACIQFVPTLDGKELITVESLEHANGALHPVQQAMV